MTATCIARLKKELKKLKKDPNQYFETIPLSENIRTWHYVLKGPKNTDYSNGYYHGVLKFPKDYPYKPPSIMLFTPNGRFQINTKICLSNSDFHPESWSPFWSVNNILTGFVSFMNEESSGLGSLNSNSNHRKLLAKNSLKFNCKNPQFKLLFPKYYKLYKQELLNNKHKIKYKNNNNLIQKQQQINIKNDIKSLPKDRDQVLDWLIISIVIMVLAYAWKMFMY